MEQTLSCTAIESYEIIIKIGSYKIHALVTFKPVLGNLCENIVELYIGLNSLSAPIKFFICGISKLTTAAQKEEFARNIVNSHATILLPYLIRWKDGIDALDKEEVQRIMKIDEYATYATDAALDLLKTYYPKVKFGNMMGRFERR